MASAGSLNRLEILAHALVERGMPEDGAESLSCELIAHHPFAGRYGVPALIGAIRERGIGGQTAEDTALMLVGVELLTRGATYGQLLEALERHAHPPLDLQGIALESSGLYRAIAAGRPVPAPAGGARLAWAVFLLVVSTGLAALWHATF